MSSIYECFICKTKCNFLLAVNIKQREQKPILDSYKYSRNMLLDSKLEGIMWLTVRESKRTRREVVERDSQARKLNKEDAIDRSRWRELMKGVWWSGWVWVGECFFWYRPIRVVPDTHTHQFNCPFSGTTQVSRYQKRQNQSGFRWSKREWVAVASAETYASLHLAPDR